MEILEKLSSERTPKKRIKLVGQMFADDFDLAVRVLFSGIKKQNIPPLFKNRNFLNEFWKSELPAKYGWQIVSQSLNASDFWEQYFQQAAVCDDFVSTGFVNNPELMLKSLRWHGGFVRGPHWESFRPFIAELNDNQSREFLAGAEFFRELRAKQDDALKKLVWGLKNTTIDALLCAFVLFSEKIYFLSPNDFAFMAQRPILLSVLEEILNAKFKAEKESQRKWPDERRLNKELIRQIKALSEGQGHSLFALFLEFDQHAQAKYLLQMFQWHDWVVDCSEGIPVVRPRDNAWRIAWDQTEVKYRVFHDYYSGFDLEDAQSAEDLAAASPNEISRAVVRRIYFGMRFIGDEMGIDDKISIQGSQVDLMTTLVILNRFSGCYEAQYQHAMAEQKRAGVDVSSAIMNVILGAGGGPRFPLEIRDIHQIVATNSSNQIEESLEDTKLMFELGSANLDQFPVRIDGQAFLKTPVGYLLLMRYFHPDIKTVLFNSIVRQNRHGNKEYSTFQENKIAEILRFGGWRAISSTKLRDKDGRTSEIDVIAYKDGVLFLIETKLTYFRTSIKEIHDHLPQLEKAGTQLGRAMTAVEDDYLKVCDWLKIDETFDQLRIVPLIVSSSFEYDHQTFNGFRKVSLFELQLLLQGTTPFLKGWLSLKEKALAGMPPDLYDKVVTGYASDADWGALKESMAMVSIEDDLDKIIYNGSMKKVLRGASAEDVADAIQTGEVWSHLLREPMPVLEKLAPLTIYGEVIANYAV